jgi:flagellar basal body rod protein FlgB
MQDFKSCDTAHTELEKKYFKLKSLNGELVAELENIANADTSTWFDPSDSEFKLWAQSRARFALAKGETKP